MSNFLVVLCAVGAVSGLPISQEDRGGDELLKSEGRSEGLEKTICIRYNEKAETNKVTDDMVELSDEHPWLLIRLGKGRIESRPKVVNYKILKINEAEDHPFLDGGNTSGSQKKMIPGNPEGLEISLVNSTNETCNENTTAIDRKSVSDSNSTSMSDMGIIESNNTMFNATETRGTSSQAAEEKGKTRSHNSSVERDVNDSNDAHKSHSNKSNITDIGETSYASANSSNSSSNKTVTIAEMVTNSMTAIGGSSIEDSSLTTEVTSHLTERRNHTTGSKETVQNISRDGSDEGFNKSTEIDQVSEDYADQVSEDNAKNFPCDVVTDSYGVVLGVISQECSEDREPSRGRESSVNAGNETNRERDNSTIDYDFETELSNGTDSSFIRDQIRENDTNVYEIADSVNVTEEAHSDSFIFINDETDFFTLTAVDATTSPPTDFGSSDEQTNSTTGNASEAVSISGIVNEEDGPSTLSNLDTTVTGISEYYNSDDKIINRIRNVTEKPTDTEAVIQNRTGGMSSTVSIVTDTPIDSTSSTVSVSPTTTFLTTTNPTTEAVDFRSEQVSTTELPVIAGITQSQEVQTISTNPSLELTTIRKPPPALSAESTSETRGLTTITPKLIEDTFRLEPTTEIPATTVDTTTQQQPSTVEIMTSTPQETANGEILQTRMPSSPPPPPASADSLITPSTADTHPPFEQIHRLLPVPPTPPILPDWVKFNNFTIVFPTRRTYFMRPYHNPFMRGLYYMPPVDPRLVQPGEFAPYPYN